MSPSPLHSLAISQLEELIDRALDLDPAARRKLQRLDGQRFELNLRAPDLDLCLAIQGGRLRLQQAGQAKATTALQGRWSEFARVASASDPAAALINGEIRIDGDTGPLLELRALLSELDIDWERPLAEAFGDVAGHQIGRGLRAGQRWLKDSGPMLQRQLREFLLEESRLLPHPLQAEAFYRDVDALRDRSDRLEARLRRLQQRLGQPAGKAGQQKPVTR